jgi:alpha-beta hydrolase superfamily lysophospholipase
MRNLLKSTGTLLFLSTIYWLVSPRAKFALKKFEDLVLRDNGAPHPSYSMDDFMKLDANLTHCWFPSLDKKTKLNGWLVGNKNNTKNTLLFCTGRVTSIGDTWKYVSWMLEAGHSVFVFEYRGVGNSPGLATFKGIHEDGLAAYDYLSLQLGYASGAIGIYGQSLGGFVASYISSNRQSNLGALCLQSTGDKISRSGRIRNLYLRLFPDFMMPSPQMNNISHVRKNQRDLYILHGEKDSDSWIDNNGVEAPGFSPLCADRLYSAAMTTKQRHMMPNSGHLNLGETDRAVYIKALASMHASLNKVVSRQIE